MLFGHTENGVSFVILGMPYTYRDQGSIVVVDRGNFRLMILVLGLV